MNDMGTPAEMGTIEDLSNKDPSEQIVEVNKPFETTEPLDIRDRASVTVI